MNHNLLEEKYCPIIHRGNICLLNQIVNLNNAIIDLVKSIPHDITICSQSVFPKHLIRVTFTLKDGTCLFAVCKNIKRGEKDTFSELGKIDNEDLIGVRLAIFIR